jgi:hypothetical protein
MDQEFEPVFWEFDRRPHGVHIYLPARNRGR